MRQVPGDADTVTGRELVAAHARAVPRQLPAAVAHFAGRTGELVSRALNSFPNRYAVYSGW
jgi:hypothetical protein